MWRIGAIFAAFLCAASPALAQTYVISPEPIQSFTDNNGIPCVGCKLFTYQAGSTTKIATYTSTGGTSNTNPIVLNARGEANVWLLPTTNYKFVLSPSTDGDPPTNPFWTVDNIQSWPTSLSALTINGTLTVTPPNGGRTQGIVYTQTVSGTTANVGLEANSFRMTNTGITTANTYDFVSTMAIWQTAGGANVKTNLTALDLHMDVTSTTGCGALNACNSYQSAQGQSVMWANQGGTGLTGSTAKGAIFGAGFTATAHSGATNILDVKAMENNWACESGSTVYICGGLALVPFGTHAVSGVLDMFIDIGNESAKGINNVLLLNDSHGAAPLDATNGCIICTDGAAHTIKDGINFGNYTVTSNYLMAANAAITGAGAYFGRGVAHSLGATSNNQWSIQNDQDGLAEVDFINRTSFGSGFDFYQMSALNTGAQVLVADTAGVAVSRQITAYATNATGPFVFLTTAAGAPTGTPSGAGAGKTAVTINSTDHKICWHEAPTSTWYCAQGM